VSGCCRNILLNRSGRRAGCRPGEDAAGKHDRDHRRERDQVNRIGTAAGLLTAAVPSLGNRHHVRKLPEYPAEEIRPPGRVAALGEMPPVNMTGITAGSDTRRTGSATLPGCWLLSLLLLGESSPCPEAAGMSC